MGDGKLVKAWTDNWLGKDVSIKSLEVISSDEFIGAKVFDLVDDHGDWKWSSLQQWLPQDCLNRLHACIPPCPGKDTDQIFVGSTLEGRFSIKEIYNQYSGHEEVSIDDMWKKIWKLAVSERCITFI